jgi:hypothetical protein
MANYIIPIARCLETGQTVKVQDLSGRRLQMHEKLECQRMADRLAEQLTVKTRKSWQGLCLPFTT